MSDQHMAKPARSAEYEEPEEPWLLTAEQLSERLQVSTRTLWRMRSAGTLPAPVRLGSAVRWRSEEIENWVRSGCPSGDGAKNRTPRR